VVLVLVLILWYSRVVLVIVVLVVEVVVLLAVLLAAVRRRRTQKQQTATAANSYAYDIFVLRIDGFLITDNNCYYYHQPPSITGIYIIFRCMTLEDLKGGVFCAGLVWELTIRGWR